MKTITFAIISAVLLISLLVVCGGDDNIVDSKVNYIVPLAVNNAWEYAVYNINDEGDTTSTTFRLVKVIKDSVVNDTTWFLMADIDGDTVLTRNTDSGLVVREQMGTCLLYKYPATPGDSYDCSSYALQVMSVNSPVTVVAGGYHCIEYRQNISFQADTVYHYCAINTGIILKDVLSPKGDNTSYISRRYVLNDIVKLSR